MTALLEPQNAASGRGAQQAGFALEREIVRPGNRRMLLYGTRRRG